MQAEQITDPVAHHAEGPVWSPRWGGLRWVDMVAGVRESIAYMNDPAHLKEVAAVAAGFTKEPSSVTEAALPKFLSLGVWPKTEDGLDRAAVEHTIEGAVAAGNVPKQKAPTYDDMVDPSVFADATGK